MFALSHALVITLLSSALAWAPVELSSQALNATNVTFVELDPFAELLGTLFGNDTLSDILPDMEAKAKNVTNGAVSKEVIEANAIVKEYGRHLVNLNSFMTHIKISDKQQKKAQLKNEIEDMALAEQTYFGARILSNVNNNARFGERDYQSLDFRRDANIGDKIEALIAIILVVIGLFTFIASIPQRISDMICEPAVNKVLGLVAVYNKPIMEVVEATERMARKLNDKPLTLDDDDKDLILIIKYANFMFPKRDNVPQHIPRACHIWLEHATSKGPAPQSTIRSCLRVIAPSIEDIGKQGQVFQRLFNQNKSQVSQIRIETESLSVSSMPSTQLQLFKSKLLADRLTDIAYPDVAIPQLSPFSVLDWYRHDRERAAKYDTAVPALYPQTKNNKNRADYRAIEEEVDPDAYFFVRWPQQAIRGIRNMWHFGGNKRAERYKLRELRTQFKVERKLALEAQRDRKWAKERVSTALDSEWNNFNMI